MPVCKSWMKYAWEGAHCEIPSWEHDPEDLCILHSLQPHKNKSLFDQTLKEKLDSHDFDFRGVFFPGPVSFVQQAFDGPARFQNAQFVGWADFREAGFATETNFSRATFAQAANFTQTKFGGPVRFGQTAVLGEADFREAGFAAEGLFQGINAASQAPFQASFQNIHFEVDGRLHFQDLSLEQVSFLGSDMRRVAFHNVRWPVLHGRQIVFDELRLHKKHNRDSLGAASRLDYGLRDEDICARLEKLYRYLKWNYEQEGDQKQAGDFHYGEMDMHRRADAWRRRFPLSWYNLYWALSGYGERPLRALAWLLGLLGGLAGLMSATGLQTSAGARVGFGTAIIFLLEQATLLRPAWAAPVTTGGHVVGALSRILIPAQAALFILALRNRLGRRR